MMIDCTGRQPACKPVRRMVELWEESNTAVSDATRPLMRGVTKPVFMGLSEEERGSLLEDFLIIKDLETPVEFIPKLVYPVYH